MFPGTRHNEDAETSLHPDLSLAAAAPQAFVAGDDDPVVVAGELQPLLIRSVLLRCLWATRELDVLAGPGDCLADRGRDRSVDIEGQAAASDRSQLTAARTSLTVALQRSATRRRPSPARTPSASDSPRMPLICGSP